MSDEDAVAQLQEVTSLLQDHADPKVREAALDVLLKMTATPEGCRQVHFADGTLAACRALGDHPGVNKAALNVLTNLAATDGAGPGAEDMLERGIVDTVHALLAARSCQTHREALMFLANLTRAVAGAERMMQTHVEGLGGLHMRKLLHWYLASSPTADGGPWDFVAYIVFNVSQIQEGRDLMRRRSTNLLQQILPQLRSPSVVRRRGTAGTVYNMCFEEDDHYWLLNEVKIVPHCLYPLAGPDELTLEEKTGMDPTLWIEGEDKVRETDEETIQMLLKALLLLCTSRRGREKLRKEKVYIIVRNMDLALAAAEEAAKGDGEAAAGSGATIESGDADAAAEDDGGTYVPTLAEQELGVSDLIYKLVNMLQGDEEYALNRADAVDEAARKERQQESKQASDAGDVGPSEGAALAGIGADVD